MNPSCNKDIVPKCKKKVIDPCEESSSQPTPTPTPTNGVCKDYICPNYPDMSKYILKSKIPASPNINKIIKEKIKNIPKIDFTKYILKSKINSCSPQADLSKYVLKASIPPPCKKCLDKPCESHIYMDDSSSKIKPKICCPAKPKLISSNSNSTANTKTCCNCNTTTNESEEENVVLKEETISNEEAIPRKEEQIIPKNTKFIPKEENSIPTEETIKTQIESEIESEIDNTIHTYGPRCSSASQVDRKCIPFFKNNQDTEEPDGLISGVMFK